MTVKAIFLDFYGTLVYEDDEILRTIVGQIHRSAEEDNDAESIGKYWWSSFSELFRASRGEHFESQRTLALRSLQETISRFGSTCRAEELIAPQYEHWVRPPLFDDTLPFLHAVREQGIPAYILSNIDTADVLAAALHNGIETQGVITSEDVRSYKPDPELFHEALSRYRLKPDEVIHVGDSLTSDVAGAQGAGIRAVWVNRFRKAAPDTIRPEFTVTGLREIERIVGR